MKILMYNSLMDHKLVIGLPISFSWKLALFTVGSYIIFRNYIALIPSIIIYFIVTMMTRKDPLLIEIIIENLKLKKYLKH